MVVVAAAQSLAESPANVGSCESIVQIDHLIARACVEVGTDLQTSARDGQVLLPRDSPGEVGVPGHERLQRRQTRGQRRSPLCQKEGWGNKI